MVRKAKSCKGYFDFKFDTILHLKQRLAKVQKKDEGNKSKSNCHTKQQNQNKVLFFLSLGVVNNTFKPKYNISFYYFKKKNQLLFHKTL